MRTSSTENPLPDYEKLSGRDFLSQVLLLFVWVGFLSYFIYSAERYLANWEKILLGWLALVMTFLLYKLPFSRRLPWRIIFIILSAFLGLRYLCWRTFETLYYTGPIDFAGLSLLYFAEFHAIGLHLLSLFINISPLERRGEPEAADDPDLPAVDVMIPTFNEPEEIIRITLAAAVNIQYPKDKLRVHLLDDGSTIARRNDPGTSGAAWRRYYSLRAMAKDMGADYITRETNIHAKAGNINHALRQTSGELVLLLDCDHVPTRDILVRTAGYFRRDPKLYLVQTPHFFINPTPVEKNLSDVSSVSVENDMFFRIIHRGLDFWNSSYFCGSAALLRRSSLEEIGGVATGTITEDAETSLILHGKGYNSIYIDRPMVCGLSPETFSDYVTQRTRWAQGMIQLFMLKNALTMKSLSIAQKICYFNSSFFWFFGISRLVFYIAPALFLLFGMKIYHASMTQIIAYAVPYVLCTVMVMDFLYGKARRPFFSEIYESVQSLFLIPAIFSVILHPRKPAFKTTSKGSMTDKESLNPLAVPFFLVAMTNLICLPMAVYKWIYYPLFRDVVVVTAVWCAFNLLLALASLGTFWEKRQVRRHHRIRAKGNVTVRVPRLGLGVKGRLENISLTGVSLRTRDRLDDALVDDEAEIAVTDSYGEPYTFKARIRRVSRRGEGFTVGAQLVCDGPDFARAVQFVYGDSQRWMDSWQEKTRAKGVWRLLWNFIVLGLVAQKEIAVYYIKRAGSAIAGRVKAVIFPNTAMVSTSESETA